MYMQAITNLMCNEKETPKMCFMALHDRSNLFLVMHMHAIRYVMQCLETHLRCFLFIKLRLVIACIYITRNK